MSPQSHIDIHVHSYIYIFFSSDILLHLSYGLDTISDDDDESITINLLPLILQSVPGAQERYEKIHVHVDVHMLMKHCICLSVSLVLNIQEYSLCVVISGY